MTIRVYYPPWVYMLPLCVNKSLTQIRKESGVSFGYCRKIIAEFIDRGWVIKDRLGLENIVNLTADGEQIAIKCIEMKEMIK
jgi:predicted transcriptional regulator